jgi:DNA-binding GntR family transcriptional regulator
VTRNDRWLTKAMLRVLRKHRMATEAIRAGDVAGAIDWLEQMTAWVDDARRRAKELANETSPSR